MEHILSRVRSIPWKLVRQFLPWTSSDSTKGQNTPDLFKYHTTGTNPRRSSHGHFSRCEQPAQVPAGLERAKKEAKRRENRQTPPSLPKGGSRLTGTPTRRGRDGAPRLSSAFWGMDGHVKREMGWGSSMEAGGWAPKLCWGLFPRPAPSALTKPTCGSGKAHHGGWWWEQGTWQLGFSRPPKTLMAKGRVTATEAKGCFQNSGEFNLGSSGLAEKFPSPWRWHHHENKAL